MANRRPRYSLFDLMMFSMLVGLLLGFFQSLQQLGAVRGRIIDSPLLILLGLFFWFVTWVIVRARTAGAETARSAAADSSRPSVSRNLAR